MKIQDCQFENDYIELNDTDEGLTINMFNDNYSHDVAAEIYINSRSKARALVDYINEWLEDQQIK